MGYNFLRFWFIDKRYIQNILIKIWQYKGEKKKTLNLRFEKGKKKKKNHCFSVFLESNEYYINQYYYFCDALLNCDSFLLIKFQKSRFTAALKKKTIYHFISV